MWGAHISYGYTTYKQYFILDNIMRCSIRRKNVSCVNKIILNLLSTKLAKFLIFTNNVKRVSKQYNDNDYPLLR